MAFQYSPKIATDGLILYLDSANSRSYPGSGTTWSDISRNNNDAVLFNSSFSSDNMGSMVLNGTNTYAYGISPSIGSEGTVNIWFKQSVAGNNKGIFSIIPETPGIGYALFYIGSGNQLTIYNGTSYSSSVPISDTYSWNMATYAWSGASASIYINADDSTSVTSSISFPTFGDYYVGVYSTLSPTSFFDGRISNVQVYNRMLSFDEISKNYLAIRSRY